ncbi:MAG: OmpA family protein [Pseudomonadota bacterium]
MNYILEKSMTGLIFASVPLLAVVACTSEDTTLAQQEPQIKGMQEQVQAVRDRISEPTDATTTSLQEYDDEGEQQEDAHATIEESPTVATATVDAKENPAPLTADSSVAAAPARVFLYGFDKKELSEQDRYAIKQYAALLLQNPNSVLTIRGHADAQGPASYNQSLSEQRAQKVGELLVAEGVPTAQLRISGMGDRIPVTDAKAYTQNRRVELSYGDTQLAAAP